MNDRTEKLLKIATNYYSTARLLTNREAESSEKLVSKWADMEFEMLELFHLPFREDLVYGINRIAWEEKNLEAKFNRLKVYLTKSATEFLNSDALTPTQVLENAKDQGNYAREFLHEFGILPNPYPIYLFHQLFMKDCISTDELLFSFESYKKADSEIVESINQKQHLHIINRAKKTSLLYLDEYYHYYQSLKAKDHVFLIAGEYTYQTNSTTIQLGSIVIEELIYFALDNSNHDNQTLVTILGSTIFSLLPQKFEITLDGNGFCEIIRYAIDHELRYLMQQNYEAYNESGDDDDFQIIIKDLYNKNLQIRKVEFPLNSKNINFIN